MRPLFTVVSHPYICSLIMCFFACFNRSSTYTIRNLSSCISIQISYTLLTMKKGVVTTGCDLQDTFRRPSPIPVILDGNMGKKLTSGASVIFSSVYKPTQSFQKETKLVNFFYLSTICESFLYSCSFMNHDKKERTDYFPEKKLQRQPECCHSCPTLQAQVKL